MWMTYGIFLYFSGMEDESSDESETEMETEGAGPYSSTSGAKHDLMLKQEVNLLKIVWRLNPWPAEPKYAMPLQTV